MRKSELDKYRTLLEAKLAELADASRNREYIAIEKAPDELDAVQFATERDLAIRELVRTSSLRRDVDAALARIADGSYGTCLECGREIKPKRLEAVPWAALCVGCQELADRETRGGPEPPDDLLREAA